MTKKSRYIHKLANALRAFRGTRYNRPQKKARQRVERWLQRCELAGYIHPKLWKHHPLNVQTPPTP